MARTITTGFEYIRHEPTGTVYAVEIDDMCIVLRWSAALHPMHLPTDPDSYADRMQPFTEWEYDWFNGSAADGNFAIVTAADCAADFTADWLACYSINCD